MTLAISYLAYGLIAVCTVFCVVAVVWLHTVQVWRDIKAARRSPLYVVDDRAVRRIGGGT